MTKRIRAITLSCVTVLCCIAIIIGATYALFTDSAKVTNHLQAGNLKVKLYRESYDNLLLNDQGALATQQNDTRTEITKDTANIFGLDNAKVIPGCELKATFTLQNSGNIEVNYYLEFVVKNGGDATDQSKLNEIADQIWLTVTIGSDKKTPIKLSQLADNTFGGQDSPLGPIALNGTATFTVELEFRDLDDAVNNTAQNQTITVDMIVHAQQVIPQK